MTSLHPTTAPRGTARRSETQRPSALCLVGIGAGALLLFWPTLVDLVMTWARDPDYSHGFLIPVISGWILYTRREGLRIEPAPRVRSAAVLVGMALLVFFLGHASDTKFFERIGLFGVMVGGAAWLWGWGLLRSQPFPFFFLLFAIPPPAPILHPLRLMLKRVATRLSDDALSLLGFDAVAEGNVLVIGEHQLGVADACTGIRSLVAIAALAVLLAFLFRAGVLGGMLLMVAAVPITVVMNVLRIVVVALGLALWNVDLANGWPHQVLGLLVFAGSLACLFGAWRLFEWMLGRAPTAEDSP